MTFAIVLPLAVSPWKRPAHSGGHCWNPNEKHQRGLGYAVLAEMAQGGGTMKECTKRGCRDLREERDPSCCKIRRICNECGRVVVTITYQEKASGK